MKTYLLVHGAWHGAWAWDETKAKLQAKGHVVHVLDLPGHGQDQTPIKGVSFRKYVDAVKSELSKIPTKVVLVGHSLAGAIIAQAAEEVPSKVESLAFVAAIVMEEKQSALDLMKADTKGELLPNLIFSEDQSSATVSAETLKNVIYNGGTEAQIGRAAPLLRPQATEPFFAHTSLTASNFGSIPKLYVECSNDKVLTPPAQRAIANRLKCRSIHTIPSGHVPLVTAPDRLAGVLLEA